MVDKVLFSSESVEWGTPDYVFNPLNNYYSFNLDPCATKENAKVHPYFSKKTDGLKQDWIIAKPYQHGTEGEWAFEPVPGRVFCNPPYGRGIIDEWVKKAVSEFVSGNAELVVLLLPARTCTKWFHDLLLHTTQLCFIKGRIKFVGSDNSAPFPSMIVTLEEDSRYFRPVEVRSWDPRDNTCSLILHDQ